jgi:serine/threonine protein phosphatase PrpC
MDRIEVQPEIVGDPGAAGRRVRPGMPESFDAPPDTAIDGADIEGMTVRAASVRGLQHRHYGTARQDSFAFGYSDDRRWLLVAVADGVGSAPRSQVAAAIACHDGLRHVAAVGPTRADWQHIFSQVSHAILGAALGTDPAAELATTLTIAAISLEAGERGRDVTVAWIGNSPVVAFGTDGWSIITRATGFVRQEHGPRLVSADVVALPIDDPVPELRSFSLRSGEALFLMSDGVSEPLGEGEGAVGEALAAWWASPPDMLSFAAQVGFARRGFADDRTVVGVWTERPR